MSERYPGGIITKNPATPTGPFNSGSAPGVWTLEQQMQYQQQGVWPTAGLLPPYIEDVFSTYLYTGNNSTLSINNGIDVSGKGGLVWIKNRQQGAYYHTLVDTARGANNQIYSNATDAQYDATGLDVTAFTSTGFTLGPDNYCNQNNGRNVSWTFRKEPKFFDVVTYTGNATGPGTGQAISHNLGSVPGCIIVKQFNTTRDWAVYHRSLANTEYLTLNSTAAKSTDTEYWRSTTPTSASFSVGNSGNTNANGGTYVAYLFAHDAGGFGLTGTDNVISCGSYTHTSGTDTAVSLGYEPQWLLIKSSSSSGSNWFLVDNMRGLVVEGNDTWLVAQSSNAENTSDIAIPQATGFSFPAVRASGDYIYIAIRRGPMKVPTVGTSVFATQAYSGGSTATISTNFPPEVAFVGGRSGPNAGGFTLFDKLRGRIKELRPYQDGAEADISTIFTFLNTSLTIATESNGNINYSGNSYINYCLGRAPGFMDVVCYTGTGANTTFTHNLGVVPELIIVKKRSDADDWAVYAGDNTDFLLLNTTAATADNNTYWNDTTPTSTVFSVGTNTDVNTSAATYVAYLFATCAGVSKVGSYTGTGTTQTINCGFTAGARFVLIKRTDSTGDWYVWDTARGIVSGNDPYLLLNSDIDEISSTDYIDTASTGFEISSTAPAAINANGGSFIFLAIA